MSHTSYHYKMLIMYDGTPFSGWQTQSNGVSIQQTIQQVIYSITHQEVSLTGSGRTDAGVHATEQVAHFQIAKELDTYKFRHSLNALLPGEISIKEVSLTDSTFHARYSAVRKTYRYHVCTSRHENPFTRLYAWHFVDRIDLPLLKKAASQLLGTHDFTSFANESHSGSAARNPVRTLSRLDVIETEEGIVFELEANGFLYKMVRNIIGTLFHIATGKFTPDSIPLILEAKNRIKAGPAAPPHGLFLINVNYGTNLQESLPDYKNEEPPVL